MAKKLKIKVPKRVAGLKIPRSVRKGPIPAFLNSSAGQLILAQALVAAAGVFAASRTDEDSPVGEAVRHPADTAKRVTRSLRAGADEQATRLSFALKEAARAFRTAMEEGPPAGEAEWKEPATEVEEPTAKKKSSRAAATTPH